MADDATRSFFNDMAPRYDRDLEVLGWDPVALMRRWPFVVEPGARVLDAGCGTGALLAHLAGADRTLAGFDLSPEMIRQARRRQALRGVELQVWSAGEAPWPFPDRSFDRVFALAMLEFVESLEVAFDELHRVLAPGGRALVSVEDVRDWEGRERPRRELRYGEFLLWRRAAEELEQYLPPGLSIERVERVRGYEVVEYGFTAAYLAVELVRDWD